MLTRKYRGCIRRVNLRRNARQQEGDNRPLQAAGTEKVGEVKAYLATDVLLLRIIVAVEKLTALVPTETIGTYIVGRQKAYTRPTQSLIFNI
jgi:hypothetical protein